MAGNLCNSTTWKNDDEQSKKLVRDMHKVNPYLYTNLLGSKVWTFEKQKLSTCSTIIECPHFQTKY